MPPLSRVKAMRSHEGDQEGKLSFPEVSVVLLPASRFSIWRLRSSLAHTRYTMCFPSGEQLGNPLLRGPLVSSRVSEPSGRIMISCEGWISRSCETAPDPKTTHCPSGDHEGEKAPPPSCWKSRLRLVPSTSLT